jgi:hypothetical protein
MNETEKLALGFLAFWLAASPILTALQILHSLREKAVTGLDLEKTKLSAQAEVAYCQALLWNSFVPLLTGYLVFFAMVTAFAVALPLWWRWPQPFNWVSYAVALQFALSFVGFLVGGYRDVALMRGVIRERQAGGSGEGIDVTS